MQVPELRLRQLQMLLPLPLLLIAVVLCVALLAPVCRGRGCGTMPGAGRPMTGTILFAVAVGCAEWCRKKRRRHQRCSRQNLARNLLNRSLPARKL
eukprot:4480569-Pleurochrysis_carterae.AAC.2